MTDVYLILTGILAGFIGSLSGLGGGIIVIPALTLIFKVPIEYAAGASLVATIATSSGAASAYIKDRLTNVKIGMSLEIATTVGACLGALLATILYSQNLRGLMFIFFGVILLFSLVPTMAEIFRKSSRTRASDKTTRIFQLEGSYFDPRLKKHIHYAGVRWWQGELIMLAAGIISGLLGIGSGALKVIGMDWVMRLPFKVSTATSNFMIGVTAAAGSGAYWAAGYIKPAIVAPAVVGILIGSFLGTRLLIHLHHLTVRVFFIFIIFLLAIEMVWRGYVTF
jgi:uncharacterized protein